MTKLYRVNEQFVKANGLNFCVHERGPKDGPVAIFIMGFAAQLTLWPTPLLHEMVDRGFRVICIDNRDIGLSDKVENKIKVDMGLAFLQYKLGRRFDTPYTLFDMADDVIGIMDAMKIDQAHIIGASMGGMIAQILSARHHERVASLSLFMTSNNSPKQPLPDLKIIMSFLRIGRGKSNPETALSRTFAMWKAIQSPGYPVDDHLVKAMIKADMERSYRPGGIVRQLQAILATGSIRYLLDLILAPTVVIHGEEDPLLSPKNSLVLAEKIPHAEHISVAGMGHDLPEELLVYFADLIFNNANRDIPSKRIVKSQAFALT